MAIPRTLTATVAADGTAVIRVRPDGSRPWSVTQVSVEMASAPSGATCAVRRNDVLVTPVIAAGDAASGDPPVLLNPEDDLTVVWTSCTPGDIGRALIFYDVGEVQ
jgi:hypothetical protein